MDEQSQQVNGKQALAKIIFKEGFDNKEMFSNSTELISFVQMWLETYEPDWDPQIYMEVLSDKYLFMKKIYTDSPTIGNISGLPVMAEKMYMSFDSFMRWLYFFDYGWAIEGDLDTTINFDMDSGVIVSRLKDTNTVHNKIGINQAPPGINQAPPGINQAPPGINKAPQESKTKQLIADYQEQIDKSIEDIQKGIQTKSNLIFGIDRRYLWLLIVLVSISILSLLFL